MKISLKMFLLIFLLLIFIFPYVVTADIPHLINYQGKLTDSSGVPLNGSYDITFRIYDAESGGNLLWTEAHTQSNGTAVTITKGIFSIMLGSVTNLNLAFDKPYYLGIQVGGDAEMIPRQQITSVGYAIRAEKAENANNAALLDNYDTSISAGASKIYVSDGSGYLPVGTIWRHSGTQVYSGPAPTSYTDLDLSSVVGANRALVMLKVQQTSSAWLEFTFRTNGETGTVGNRLSGGSIHGAGTSGASMENYGNITYIFVETDSSGIVEWESYYGGCSAIITVVGYIK